MLSVNSFTLSNWITHCSSFGHNFSFFQWHYHHLFQKGFERVNTASRKKRQRNKNVLMEWMNGKKLSKTECLWSRSRCHFLYLLSLLSFACCFMASFLVHIVCVCVCSCSHGVEELSVPERLQKLSSSVISLLFDSSDRPSATHTHTHTHTFYTCISVTQCFKTHIASKHSWPLVQSLFETCCK